VDDYDRAVDRAEHRLDGVAVGEPGAAAVDGGDQHLGRGLEAPCHAVLDVLGRVRLGQHVAEEELDEAAIVLAPVVRLYFAQPS